MKLSKHAQATLYFMAIVFIGASGATATGAAASADLTQVAANVAKSLVYVQYTAENEFHKTRKANGQGVLLTKSGVVLVSQELFPIELPSYYIKTITIRLPRGSYAKIPATFLGRSANNLFAYVKADKPLNATPLTIGDTGNPTLGEKVYSVALLSKEEGYQPFVGISHVKAVITLIHKLAITNPFSLTRSTSPVYDYHTGKLVGFTGMDPGQALDIALAGHVLPVLLQDPEQGKAFLAWSDIATAFKNVPEKPFITKRPWLGAVDLTGLKPALRKLYKIKQRSGITIGSVIANFPAAKAGLKSQDIILAMNGREFSDFPSPDLVVSQFERWLQRTAPGQTVKFKILRNGNQYMTVPVTIGAMPKLASEVKHYYNHKLGLITRNIVFDDTYIRKLPATQKGVMVALIKNGSLASLGDTPLKVGYIITKVNDQKITDATDFTKVLDAAEKAPGAAQIVFVVIEADGSTGVCRISLQ